jgi:hypothetical protein
MAAEITLWGTHAFPLWQDHVEKQGTAEGTDLTLPLAVWSWGTDPQSKEEQPTTEQRKPNSAQNRACPEQNHGVVSIIAVYWLSVDMTGLGYERIQSQQATFYSKHYG